MEGAVSIGSHCLSRDAGKLTPDWMSGFHVRFRGYRKSEALLQMDG